MNRLRQWLRGFIRKRPVVVAALQSPHLLNNWAEARDWHLYYDLLGDHDGLAETKDIQLPYFDQSGIHPEKVRAVLVTSPLQLETARSRYPNARVFWVVHTGYFLDVLPKEHAESIDGIITLTRTVQRIQLEHKPQLMKKSNYVIAPYYRPETSWEWTPNLLWTIRSRAGSRMPASKQRFDFVIAGIRKRVTGSSNLKLLFFGQDAPDGYISEKGKRALWRQSSAYISALPIDAGFGLAEHEAMAHGVPIVGSRWGDIDDEMSPDYPSLVTAEEDMVEVAINLAHDRQLAEKASRLGLDYIRNCRSKKHMNSQVRSFARDLQDSPVVLI